MTDPEQKPQENLKKLAVQHNAQQAEAEEMRQELAAKFKAARKETGHTQASAWNVCDVNRRTWQYWEDGGRPLPSYAKVFIFYLQNHPK